jgi:CHAD domain-containing protein
MSEFEQEPVRKRALEISREPGSGGPEENWFRAERELTVEHEYDTSDRDLEQAGIQVSRLPLEAGVVWRLSLPRGERVEIWSSGTEGLALPPEIMELVGGILDGKELVPSAPLSSDPGARRLRELILEQRHALVRHEPGVRIGTDPDNLRKHRVAARRTRAFLRSARRYVDPDWRRSIAGALGDLGTATGPVRDLDVLLAHVRAELAGLAPEDHGGGGFLVARLELDREQARRRLLAALQSDGYRMLLGRLRPPPRLAPGVETVALAELARTEFAALAKNVGRLGKHPDDTALHALRIALKRARYAAELAGPVGKRGARFLADAKLLQDLLGEHQDATVAEHRLRASAAGDRRTEAAFVAGRLAERQRARRAAVTERLPAAWRRLRKSGNRLVS